MTLAMLVLVSQLADGLGYRLAWDRGLANLEVNPLGAAIDDPNSLLLLKIAAGCVMALGSLYLVRAGRKSWVGWLAMVGLIGCLSEITALV